VGLWDCGTVGLWDCGTAFSETDKLKCEGGADIRFIQQRLGHEKLETTSIYTQVSIEQLKAVHARTHPAETKKCDQNSNSKNDGNPLPSSHDNC